MNASHSEAERIVKTVLAWEDGMTHAQLVNLLAAIIDEHEAEQELHRLYSEPGSSSDEELIGADEKVEEAHKRRHELLTILRGGTNEGGS